MINIAPLLSPCTAPAERELSADDPELAQILSLADYNQFSEAAERAAKLWQERVYDARMLGFYLFGAFIDEGLLALPRIMTCVELSLTTNWPFLGPTTNKQRHCDGALRWLFTTITSQGRFHQRAQKQEWSRWLESWASLPQKQILQSIEQSAEVLQKVLNADAAKGALLSLRALLLTMPQANPSASAGTEAGGPTAGSGEPHEPPSAEASLDTKPKNAHSTATDPSGSDAVEPAAPTITLPLSPPMHRLLRKLDAFVKLTKMGKFRHAAIVHKDIQQIITSFDPRQYLPSIYAEYYSQVVLHAGSLTKSLNDDKGFVVDALRDLYQIDLDLFVAAKG